MYSIKEGKQVNQVSNNNNLPLLTKKGKISPEKRATLSSCNTFSPLKSPVKEESSNSEDKMQETLCELSWNLEKCKSDENSNDNSKEIKAPKLTLKKRVSNIPEGNQGNSSEHDNI